MGKPTVRIVLDKDALLKLFPEGEFESHIAFDNSVVSLINETVNRLVNKGLLERMEREIERKIEGALQDGWGRRENAKELITKAVEVTAGKLIEKKYDEFTKDIPGTVERLVKERLSMADKYVTQLTTPEAVEDLMIKACAKLVKGQIK